MLKIDPRLIQAGGLIWDVTYDTFLDQEARSRYAQVLSQIVNGTFNVLRLQAPIVQILESTPESQNKEADMVQEAITVSAIAVDPESDIPKSSVCIDQLGAKSDVQVQEDSLEIAVSQAETGDAPDQPESPDSEQSLAVQNPLEVDQISGVAADLETTDSVDSKVRVKTSDRKKATSRGRRKATKPNNESAA